MIPFYIPDSPVIQGLKTSPLQLAYFCIPALAALWTIYGAISALGARRWGIALSAAILGCIPCTGCWIITIPASIWLLIVLNRADVKAGFQAARAMPS